MHDFLRRLDVPITRGARGSLSEPIDRLVISAICFNVLRDPPPISSKGEVTVRKQIRDYLGLKPGTPVTFERLPDGEIALRAARPIRKTAPSKFAKLRGRATVRMATAEILARIEELEAVIAEASLTVETIWPLLTRDARRIRTYFPTVAAIAP